MPKYQTSPFLSRLNYSNQRNSFALQKMEMDKQQAVKLEASKWKQAMKDAQAANQLGMHLTDLNLSPLNLVNLNIVALRSNEGEGGAH